MLTAGAQKGHIGLLGHDPELNSETYVLKS
jgi:hypothetical protein